MPSTQAAAAAASTAAAVALARLAGRAASGRLAGSSGMNACVHGGCCGGGGGAPPPTARSPLFTAAAAAAPPGRADLSGRGAAGAACTSTTLGDQRRGFRIRDLFDKDKTAARRAAISEDIARGHFDDLSGAKTVDKPFPAVSFPPGPGRPPLPPLECVDAAAGSSAAASAPLDWRGWLTPGTLLLVGLRASAEAGLDSWAAGYAGALMREGGEGGEVGGGGALASSASPPSPPPISPRIVDLTIYDRTPALALALPGMKAALLRGAAAGAARRRAAVAGAHFGAAPEVRAALRLGNALAAHAVVVGRAGGGTGGGGGGGGATALGVAWLGSGVAGGEEVEAMVRAARAEFGGVV